VLRGADGEFTLDFEWYLSTQILPPISRLCEPIEGTSPAILSERLGLDASKYARMAGHADDLQEDGWGFTPMCEMADSERFKDCLPLKCMCSDCGEVWVPHDMLLLFVCSVYVTPSCVVFFGSWYCLYCFLLVCIFSS
jgi:hypothetical protein